MAQGCVLIFMKTQRTTLNGLKHQLYLWGSPKKPKLFLIHGWLDTGASFDFLCRHLEKHFYCIAPDLRGYGRSEHASNPMGYFFYEYVADLHAFFEKLSPHEKVRILGHSFGGAIASFYAGAFPERVSHFINVEGFAFRDNPPERGPEKLRHWIEELHTKKFTVFPSLKEFTEYLASANPRIPIERVRFWARHLTKRIRGGITLAADPKHKLSDPYAFPKTSYYAFWKKIEAKCLLVTADSSHMNDWVKSENLSLQIQEWFAQFPQGSPHVEIPSCGHMVHHERPEELARAVINFEKSPPSQNLTNVNSSNKQWA